MPAVSRESAPFDRGTQGAGFPVPKPHCRIFLRPLPSASELSTKMQNTFLLRGTRLKHRGQSHKLNQVDVISTPATNLPVPVLAEKRSDAAPWFNSRASESVVARESIKSSPLSQDSRGGQFNWVCGVNGEHIGESTQILKVRVLTHPPTATPLHEPSSAVGFNQRGLGICKTTPLVFS